MDPQIKRLAARYSIAFLLFTAAVIVGVWLGMRELVAEHQPAPRRLEGDVGRVAPATRRDLVLADGGLSCEGACALESVCGLRDPDTCRRLSCDGSVRKRALSDLAFASAPDCGALAAAPCEEACAKRGACTGDHGSDAVCTAECVARAQVRPRDTYASARCMLERSCAECP